MEFAFYICGLIAILATLRVITHTNPVHALLYLIISLLAISGVFFSLGAYFAGALEIIVYAGAIMVLFVFVVMMLNLGGSEIEQERQWLKPQVWIGPAILSAIMLVVIVYAILGVNDQGIDGTPISAKAVGITLFGPYVLAVELASMLLLAGLAGVKAGRRHAVGKELIDLIFHQGNKRRYHDRQAVEHQRGHLIAQRFAAAGGHYDQAVTPAQRRIDNGFLAWAKLLVAEGFL